MTQVRDLASIWVEILRCDNNAATCRVTYHDRSLEFTCGAGTEAHQALRLMVYNATQVLARQLADEMLHAWSDR